MSRFYGAVAALVLAALVGAAAAAAALWAWQAIHGPYKGYAEVEKRIVVESGQSGRAILEQLAAEGVIRDPTLTRLYLIHVMNAPSLKAGEYAFSKPLSSIEVLDQLIRGDVVLYDATLIEGLTLEESAQQLAAQGFGSELAFLAAMRDPGVIADLDPAAEDLEGYLFPDTYSFARTDSEDAIVATLVKTFRRKYEMEIRTLLPPERQLDGPRALVTLASIVEKEARIDSERATIAGVYANRLRRGIALYADPTVIFALRRLGRWDGNLTRRNLQVDSPYNTYRYPGLPPGPICSPGLASLLAAAQPAEVPYLYFVSKNDGSHVFATTLAEHNRNVETWQKQYWRDRWARERQ